MTVECKRLKVGAFIVSSCYCKFSDYYNCAKYYKLADTLQRKVFSDDEKGLFSLIKALLLMELFVMRKLVIFSTLRWRCKSA